MLNRSKIMIMILTSTLAACSYNGSIDLPGLYRIDIQQGNVIEQAMLDRLRAGMDKNQVEFILGTPAIVDPFHTDQWEYIFSMAEESEDREQRHIRVHFVEDRLSHIDGDVVVSNRELSDAIRQSRTVEVPPEHRRKRGFFARIFSAVPLFGDDRPRRAKPAKTSSESDDSSE